MSTLSNFLVANASHAVLSEEEERMLCNEYAITRDVRVRNTLVAHNIKLVLKFAKEHKNNPDVISEGYLGLIVGIDKFNPDKGVRLSTYVGYWINAYIMEYLFKNAKIVKVSKTREQSKIFYNMSRERAKMEAQGVEITPEALAEKMAVSTKSVTSMQQQLSSDVSLDCQVSGHGRESYVDVIQSQAQLPDSAIEEAEYLSMIQKFQNTLRNRDQVIFQKRLMEDKTLQEVGDEVGLTRERVRQIECTLSDRLKKFCNTTYKTA